MQAARFSCAAFEVASPTGTRRHFETEGRAVRRCQGSGTRDRRRAGFLHVRSRDSRGDQRKGCELRLIRSQLQREPDSAFNSNCQRADVGSKEPGARRRFRRALGKRGALRPGSPRRDRQSQDAALQPAADLAGALERRASRPIRSARHLMPEDIRDVSQNQEKIRQRTKKHP